VLEDGKALTGGTVFFGSVEAPGVRSSGKLQPDGSFTLTTPAGSQGAALGANRVYIEPDPSAIQRQGKRVIYPFAVQYMDEEATPLVVTITKETSALEPFVLKKVLASNPNPR
jgi:hypothetical protein